MCDPVFVRFQDGRNVTDVSLPFDLDALLVEYANLSRIMARTSPPGTFSRDEWGYLCVFFRELARGSVFETTFGQRAEPSNTVPNRLQIPKGEVAIWLPNNVSLLGPLTVMLCLLAGTRVKAKSGSNAANLTRDLRDFILGTDVGPNVYTHWSDRLETEQFSRLDARNAEWSQLADVRIIFGGDAAATAVEALPHKIGSAYFAFSDRSSQIWSEAEALDDKTLETILRVFHVYGKAGCTSPQRVMLIGSDHATAENVAARICAIANRQLRSRPPAHIASDTLMAAQVARSRGWAVSRASNGSVVFPAGSAVTDDVPGHMTLCFVPADLEQALTQLPPNIQTIGYAAHPTTLNQWVNSLSRSNALRIVPIQRMHHFSPFWDGHHFWRALFREIEIGS